MRLTATIFIPLKTLRGTQGTGSLCICVHARSWARSSELSPSPLCVTFSRVTGLIFQTGRAGGVARVFRSNEVEERRAMLPQDAIYGLKLIVTMARREEIPDRSNESHCHRSKCIRHPKGPRWPPLQKLYALTHTTSSSLSLCLSCFFPALSISLTFKSQRRA